MLTIGALSLAFEALVALLLLLMIYFSVKLNRRLGQMREREAEMRTLIDEFDAPASRAESSASHLKSVGGETECSLGGLVDRGQAIRDEWVFMMDWGDELGARLEKSLSSKGRPPKRGSTAGSPSSSA